MRDLTLPVHRAEPCLTTGEKRRWGVEMTPAGAKRLKGAGFEQFSSAQKESQKPKSILAGNSGPLLADMTAAGAKHTHGGFEQFSTAQKKSQKPNAVGKAVNMTPAGAKHAKGGSEQLSIVHKRSQKPKRMTPAGVKHTSAGEQQFSTSEKKVRKSIAGRKTHPIAKDRSGYVEESSDSEADGGPLPGFTVKMNRSNVTKGFWLTVPSKFALEHLPNEDACVVLKDSRNVKWDTNYLSSKRGLSGGWRKFVNDQNLEEGDVAYFEKYKDCRFKVTLQKSVDRNFIPLLAEPQKFLANLKKSCAPNEIKDGTALFSGAKKKSDDETVARKSMSTILFPCKKQKRNDERVADKKKAKREGSIFNQNELAHGDVGCHQNVQEDLKSSLENFVHRDNQPCYSVTVDGGLIKIKIRR